MRGMQYMRILRHTFWLIPVGCILVLMLYARMYTALPDIPVTKQSVTDLPAWPSIHPISNEQWKVVRHLRGGAPLADGPLAQRFRLAGTFFSFAENAGGGEAFCKAILDDLKDKQQHLVKEGDPIDGVIVVRVYRDHVVLRDDTREEELWLSFSDGSAEGDARTEQANERSSKEAAPLEVNRFGKRVGESRWVLKRDALMDYYDELREDPERIAALYVSMKPDYQEGAVAGYHVNITGEDDFFSAVGLKEGDTVRKVNSMKMTSQSRAEYFIGEFVKGRLSAVVLDVERGDEKKKLIYLIR